MGFMETLFGGTPEVTLPPAIKAEIAKLQYVPFGPERDALVAQISNTLGISTEQFNQSLSSLGGVLDSSEGIYQNAGDNLAGISNRMQQYAGSDPYMEFYGNPAAREQAYLAALQDANRAAFDPYGSQGSESQMRQGLMAATQARRGITNSGIARRQEEQERMRMAAARQEADSRALQQVREQGLGEAGAYQAARGLASQNLQRAGDMQGQRAQMAQYAPQQRMAAAGIYGDAQDRNANKMFAAQTEDRTGRQAVQSYNTEVQNKVLQDYASAQNKRNAGQASLDASRRKPGLMDLIGPVASLGMQVAGNFMGGPGGSTLGDVGKAVGNVAGSDYGSGYNNSSNSQNYGFDSSQLQSANINDWSRYGSSQTNPWVGY